MASPKVERSQPRSASIGSWKNPMAERGPKVITAISDPARMMSQGMAGRLVVVIGGFSSVHHTLVQSMDEQKRLLMNWPSGDLMNVRGARAVRTTSPLVGEVAKSKA